MFRPGGRRPLGAGLRSHPSEIRAQSECNPRDARPFRLVGPDGSPFSPADPVFGPGSLGGRGKQAPVQLPGSRSRSAVAPRGSIAAPAEGCLETAERWLTGSASVPPARSSASQRQAPWAQGLASVDHAEWPGARRARGRRRAGGQQCPGAGTGLFALAHSSPPGLDADPVRRYPPPQSIGSSPPGIVQSFGELASRTRANLARATLAALECPNLQHLRSSLEMAQDGTAIAALVLQAKTASSPGPWPGLRGAPTTREFS